MVASSDQQLWKGWGYRGWLNIYLCWLTEPTPLPFTYNSGLINWSNTLPRVFYTPSLSAIISQKDDTGQIDRQRQFVSYYWDMWGRFIMGMTCNSKRIRCVLTMLKAMEVRHRYDNVPNVPARAFDIQQTSHLKKTATSKNASDKPPVWPSCYLILFYSQVFINYYQRWGNLMK